MLYILFEIKKWRKKTGGEKWNKSELTKKRKGQERAHNNKIQFRYKSKCIR